VTATQIVPGSVASASGLVLGNLATSTATCPAGTLLLGGGFTLSSESLQLFTTATESRPASTTTWTATATNYATGAGTFGVHSYAVCTA